MLDFHKDVLDLEHRWLDIDIELLNSTKEVDYDQDGKSLYEECMESPALTLRPH